MQFPCCMAKLSDGYREDHLLFDGDLQVRLRLAPAFFGRPDVYDVTRRCRIDYPPRHEPPSCSEVPEAEYGP